MTLPSKCQSTRAIPVTILSGFLGSGKTTLLQHVLTSKEHQLKIAVIVNDMAELNVDAQTVQRSKDEHTVTKTQRQVISLENGCICCTLRGDLIREIHRIQRLGTFDYIIIESTGIAEPQQVAESFCVDPESLTLPTSITSEGQSHSNESEEDTLEMARMLHQTARLDTCVTVVDTANFSDYLCSLKRFQDIFEDGMDAENEEEAQKSIAELMVEQVEFANVVLFNKIDLVSAKKVNQVQRLVRRLNPKATIIAASHGKINVKEILNTGLFDMEEAKQSSEWLASLQQEGGVNAAHGEADEYGVTSFVYRARKPFHPQRLPDTFLSRILHFADDWNTKSSNGVGMDESDGGKRHYMEEHFGSILRSKGTVWIAGRDDHEHSWAHAGRIVEINPISPWYCNIPKEKWSCESVREEDRVRRHIEEGSADYGDRRQEIVFIGIDMREKDIRRALDNCLLTDDEMEHHVLDAPLGTYYDTLLPVPFECFDVSSIFAIIRPRQQQHFLVPPQFKLTITNIALGALSDSDDDSSSREVVRVYLDKCDLGWNKQGVLVATLRAGRVEQQALSMVILHSKGEDSEPSHFRLRVEAGNSRQNRKRQHASSNSELIGGSTTNCTEVHVIAHVEPVPYKANQKEDGSHDEDTESMGEEAGASCPDGHCPL